MRAATLLTWTLCMSAVALIFTACMPEGKTPEARALRRPVKSPAAKPKKPVFKGFPAPQGLRGPDVPPFWIRPGYKVELVAKDFGIARFLALDDNGNLYVSQPEAGTIATLRLRDGKYQKVGDFVTGKRFVHGLCWRDGYLWFTTSGAIYKSKPANAKGESPGVETVISEGSLPQGGHWWRSILVDHNGFYTSIGDSGNVTDQTNTDRQKIWHFDRQGGSKHLFASGLRNTEKLLFRPGTGEVWGMDHGSDWYGKAYGDREGRQPITEEVPPEKFNHYVQDGFYGHPFFVGGRYPRPEFANKPDLIDWAEKTNMPALLYGAHWAPNGWCFNTGDQIPDGHGDAFMTFHGSWNRQHKAGYRIDRTLFDKVTGQPFGHYMVVGCLTPADDSLARPVDIIQTPDGDFLWSEDQGNKIYRLRFVGPK